MPPAKHYLSKKTLKIPISSKLQASIKNETHANISITDPVASNVLGIC